MLNILITPSQIFRCRPNKTEIRTTHPHPQYFKPKTTFCRMLFYHLPSSENCKVRSLMSTEFCNEYHKFHLQMINIHVFDKHFESVKFTSTVFILKVLYYRHIINLRALYFFQLPVLVLLLIVKIIWNSYCH
jgi:hypothetical protein